MSRAPAGDVTSEVPADILGNPFKSLSSQLESFESLLRMVFEDYDEFIEDLVADVLSNPPEKRFTRSHEIAQEHIQEEFGSVSGFQSQLANLSEDQFAEFLHKIIQHLLSEILRGIYFTREADDYLYLAALLQSVEQVVRELEEVDDPEIQKRGTAVVLAMWCRLMRSARERSYNQKELVRDIARSRYYLSQVTEESVPNNPDEIPYDEVEQEVREYGAAIAYVQLKISIGRGAELADVSQQEFKTRVLPEYGVNPRAGPNNPEDLGENADLL